MSTPTTTSEDQLRLQQSYERLLRERRVSLLMGEAAAAAGAETQQAGRVFASNPIWTPQSAAALPATRAYSGAAAQSPPAAGASAAWRHRELQALDLSRQQSQLLRSIGASDAAVAGPSYVYGPPGFGTSAGTSAGVSAATSAAFGQIGRAPAAYAQAATYTQVTRPLATYGPVAGSSTAQHQAAGYSFTSPHGHATTYIPAETEARRTQMEDRRMQAISFETIRNEGPNPYVFSDQEESSTSRMRRMFYVPQGGSRPSSSGPLNNAVSNQGPTPLGGYPPIISSSEASAPQARNPPIILSSEGSTPQARYPPIIPSSERSTPQARYPPIIPSSEGSTPQARYPPIIPSSEGSAPQVRYPPMAPSSEGTTIRTGYVPATAFSDRPSQAQVATQYGSGVPPSTTSFQQTWPTFTTQQQTGMAQGHQPGPFRNRSTNRASPYSGRRTPLQQPHYHRPAVPVEAGPSTGQAPSQGPFRATVAPHIMAEPVNVGGGKYERVPILRIIQIEKKPDNLVSGIPIPGQKIMVRDYIAYGRAEAPIEPKIETNPEADTEGEEADEGARQFDVEEYEPGPDDGESEESSCSDGESGQQEVPTWQQQVREPQQTPWAAVGGAARPSGCQECARLDTPGLLCLSCRCAATGSGSAAAIGPAPAAPGGTESPTSTSAATVSSAWPEATNAGASAVTRPSVIVTAPRSPESSSSDSSVRMIVVTEPENDGDQTDQEEGDEANEGGNGEDGDEEENGEEEDDGDEDQQELTEERRRYPHETPQQEPVHSTTGSPEAREQHQDAEQSGEEAER